MREGFGRGRVSWLFAAVAHDTICFVDGCASKGRGEVDPQKRKAVCFPQETLCVCVCACVCACVRACVYVANMASIENTENLAERRGGVGDGDGQGQDKPRGWRQTGKQTTHGDRKAHKPDRLFPRQSVEHWDHLKMFQYQQ